MIALGITWAAFWTWVFWTAVTVGVSYAISQLLQKKPKVTSVEPDELAAPTVRQGTKYTVNFGTNWVENPVTAWWGDLETTAIRDHYTVNKWGNNKRVHYTIGYHYAVGMDLVLTQGQNDGVKQIKIGDLVAWPDPDDITQWQADGATSAVIDEPSLFGGRKAGGGVVGTIAFQYGGTAQTPNNYLISQLGSDISASRGLTRAIFEQIRMGTSPYMRPCKFLLKRTDILTTGEVQWYVAKAAVNTNDMNAAHILRECYTDTEWGFGYSESLFDGAAWQAVADVLYTEGFGLSMKWEDQAQTLGEFVDEVLRHIDAVLYQDPETGLFVLKLVRDDYDPASLEVFDDGDVISVSDYSVGTVYESPNFLWMKYWDRQNNKPITLPEYNLATMIMQGNKIVPQEVSYNGITDDNLARKIAARERYELSAFPFKMRIKGKRTMSHLRPGGVFKFTWPPLGITEMVIRVISPNYGTLQDGAITLNCVQDIFAVQDAIFSGAPATEWTDPRSQPVEVPDQLLQESTFWDVYLDAGLSDALGLDDGSGFLLVAASKPSSDAIDYELLLRDSPSGSFYSNGDGNFTPNGTLDASLPLDAEDAIVDLLGTEGLASVMVGDYCVIESEILKIKAVDEANDQVTLARGCLDTVPAQHSGGDTSGSGATVWFVSSLSYFAGREYADGDQPGVKILPRTGLGQLAEGDAIAHNADVFDSRMNRPYPPGDFKVDRVSYPSSFSGQLTVSWVHRDRTQQLAEIAEHSDAGVGPEAGTTYTLKIYDEDDMLVRTETGLTGTSYTYSVDDEMADCGISSAGALNTNLRFVLTAVRDGYDSWQSYDLRVNRAYWNDFTDDSNCKALWRHEDASLQLDSIGTNHLTNSGVTSNANCKEGSHSGLYIRAENDLQFISDADLDSDFPHKSSDPNKIISLCFWCYVNSMADGEYHYVYAKWSATGRTFWVRFYRNGSTYSLEVLIGTDGGASWETLLDQSMSVVGRWLHVGIVHKDSDKSWKVRVWDDTAQSVNEWFGTATDNINIGNPDLAIGSRESSGSDNFNGYIDELVVFNDVLTSAEMHAIRLGTYPTITEVLASVYDSVGVADAVSVSIPVLKIGVSDGIIIADAVTVTIP